MIAHSINTAASTHSANYKSGAISLQTVRY